MGRKDIRFNFSTKKFKKEKILVSENFPRWRSVPFRSKFRLVRCDRKYPGHCCPENPEFPPNFYFLLLFFSVRERFQSGKQPLHLSGKTEI